MDMDIPLVSVLRGLDEKTLVLLAQIIIMRENREL